MAGILRPTDDFTTISSNPIYGFYLLAGLVADEAAVGERKSSFSSGRDAGAKHRKRFKAGGALAFCLLSTIFSGVSRADEPVYDLDIPAMNAAEALNRFAEQTGAIMLFPYDLASARQANAVSGRYTLLEGLDLLLQDTGLSGGLTDKRVVNISPAENEQRLEEEEAMAVQEVPLGRKITAFVASIFSVSAASGQDNNTETLEVIIVTAQKREQNLAQVPMSISAIPSEEIERRGMVGMADYLRTLPGVNQIDRGAGRNSVIIRGVTADPQNEGFAGSPTVGIYLADIPLTGNAGVRGDSADIKLVDMERIEVLRGPQGTLYGANSLSGTVRNIPVAPLLGKLEAQVATDYSYTTENGGDNHMIQGVLNMPVGDTFAVRAVAYRFDNSGYVENVAGSTTAFRNEAAAFGAGFLAANQDNVGSDQYTGGRIAALWKPAENASVTVTFIKQDLEQDGFPEVGLELSGEFDQTRLKIGEIAGGGNERLFDDVEIVNLALDYDLTWGSFVSSTSWLDQATQEVRDIEVFFGGIPSPQVNTGESNVFVEEARFSSSFVGPFQMLVGLYYEESDIDKSFLTYYGGDMSLSPFGDDPLLFSLKPTRDLNQKAAFGELSYDLLEQLNVTVGSRYFSYERTEVTHNSGALFFEGSEVLPAEETGNTFKVSASYMPDDDVLVYAQWAEGFRLGRAEPAMPPSCDLDNDGFIDGSNNVSILGHQVDSDRLESTEVGGKVTMLDGRWSVNASVYRNTWSGIPVNVNTADCGLTYNVNGGEARSQGAEVETALHLNPDWRVSFGASYIDAELTKDEPLVGMAGDRLPGSPEFNLNLGLQYEFELAGRESFIRSDYAYVGGFYNNLQETGFELGDYHEVNLRAGTAFDRVSVELYAQNLTNADALTWLDREFTGFGLRGLRMRPRTVGASLRFSF